jgi:hypothetical protein
MSMRERAFEGTQWLLNDESVADPMLDVGRATDIKGRLRKWIAHGFHAWTEMAAYSRGSEHLGL